jgi:hypothetical protein
MNAFVLGSVNNGHAPITCIGATHAHVASSAARRQHQRCNHDEGKAISDKLLHFYCFWTKIEISQRIVQIGDWVEFTSFQNVQTRTRLSIHPGAR